MAFVRAYRPSHFLLWRCTASQSTLSTMSSQTSVGKESLEDEKVNVHVAVVTEQVDTGAQLVAGTEMEVDPKEALRIRRKIDRHLMPLMCSKWFRSAQRRTNFEDHSRDQSCIGYNSWTRRPSEARPSWVLSALRAYLTVVTSLDSVLLGRRRT